ncbi:MAG: hypothetical protein LV473_19190 [Nitrospira sp.]|nr:hypothetical protein [Nitrospira sp.]
MGGCDAVGGMFGRMFAVPPRETTYFTPTATFYIVNYAGASGYRTIVSEVESIG